ncbi:hypothetical protein C367_06173 [Cryptococcus neoformans Ze90-1]|nr:hypothetical protein C367_06173 [Cryptococcus neoformans var. grubii Ze90-1]
MTTLDTSNIWMRVDGTTERRYGTRRRAGWWMLEI